MPNNGTRIYTEVRNGVKYGVDVRSDVYKVLGIAPRKNGFDIGYACSNLHGKINPASKHKPVRYDKVGELTDRERMGTSEDWGNGIFWGVRCAGRPGKLTGLHDCYEYLPPRAGEDWMRLGDFDGYNNAAEFNPRGTVNFLASMMRGDIQVSFDIDLAPTGIDVGEIAEATSSVWGGLENYHPCILISDTERKEHWARAMVYAGPLKEDDDATDYPYLPMRNAAGNWLTQWLAEVSDFSYDTVHSHSPEKFLTAQENRLVTIFFMRHIKSPDSICDFTKWVEVSTTTITGRAFACSGAVGIVMEPPVPTGKKIEITMVSAFEAGISDRYTINGHWQGPYNAGTYHFEVSIYEKTNSLGSGKLVTTIKHEVECDGENPPDCLVPATNPLLTSTRFTFSGVLGVKLDESKTYTYRWNIHRTNGDPATDLAYSNFGSGDLITRLEIPDLPLLPVDPDGPELVE